MAKEKLNLEELKEKGLMHLAELLEGEKKDDEDEADLDDEKDEVEDDEEEEDDDKEEKDDVKESVFSKAVEGLDLQESDVAKMKEVFDTAVEARVKELTEAKLVALDEMVTARLEDQIEKNDKHISNYLDFVVEGWVKTNQLEIERQMKVELAESFLGKLKGLFEDHSVILESDEKIDQIQEAQEQVKAAKQELAEALEALAESKKFIFAGEVKAVIAELAEGFSDVQKEKFGQLVGEIDIDIKEGIDDVKSRLAALKEGFVKEFVIESEDKLEDKIIESEVQEVEKKEENIQESQKPELDEKMASYIAAAKKGLRAR